MIVIRNTQDRSIILGLDGEQIIKAALKEHAKNNPEKEKVAMALIDYINGIIP